jgi:hypothetical protein
VAQSVKNAQIADTDDLYGLPRSKFTGERNALAKRLRSEGARQAAAEAGAARKPTTPAWAVNQLVRQEPARVRELLSLGEQLREAQARMVAGSRGELLELSERERALVDELVEDASRILRASGERPSEAVVDQIRDTLHAAALDPETAEAVSRGRLTKERRAIGLGLGAGPAAPGRAPARGRPRQKAPRKEQRKEQRKAQRKAAKAAAKRQPSARLENARRRLEAARAAAGEARTKAGEAERRLAEARREADVAARAVQRTEGKARQARKAAEQAEARERKSAQALELLTRPHADD